MSTPSETVFFMQTNNIVENSSQEVDNIHEHIQNGKSKLCA